MEWRPVIWMKKHSPIIPAIESPLILRNVLMRLKPEFIERTEVHNKHDAWLTMDVSIPEQALNAMQLLGLNITSGWSLRAQARMTKRRRPTNTPQRKRIGDSHISSTNETDTIRTSTRSIATSRDFHYNGNNEAYFDLPTTTASANTTHVAALQRLNDKTRGNSSGIGNGGYSDATENYGEYKLS
ncbi:hypothetical protein CHS0354_000082 [Potamilus streckersoni]|uniref:Uncharacterized protein n=1 Tax=Potamilus streckersoni TaxID=2493646 RepID=A0AAE0TIL8_9BIVA|nr:hypothetical protein CHS0354_000082 [Potamilus streckersoni]